MISGWGETKIRYMLSAKGIDLADTYFVIWTTTTWTLPANLAICVGPNYTYAVTKANGEYYVMAEELTEYLLGLGVQTAYIHSDVDTLERVRIINELRAGVYDVLVGVNLLREGLDLPEVSLVAIFDADKEGFLRNQRSLTQTIGRAARNVNGKAIMYADTITPSMAATINETNRRREKQLQYNQDNNISPKQIRKTLSNNNLIQNSSTDNIIPYIEPAPYEVMAVAEAETLSVEQKKKRIESLRSKMQEAAKRMEFTDAAILRDEMLRLQAEVDEEQK